MHRERSGLTTTCGCLFGFVYKKKPTYLERFIREESSQCAPPFFVDGGSINCTRLEKRDKQRNLMTNEKELYH